MKRRLTDHPQFWPSVVLLILLAINGVLNPSFFTLTWRDGHLYGALGPDPISSPTRPARTT